ncbi:DUF5694 domain-containing protein [Luteimonas sp. RD2P54]|uniref:DUF5694 domain-containing protein n=1 Tax=Luteimonas endophytica TaxID=3042023 RepID=A0ABT6J9Z6_9GAMM|nr:DUF5694 domain-containing protein [Luteimonas endophytica]MDH5823644.1 DUF5694 domain-containing protein [Luteimonas endophytica]
MSKRWVATALGLAMWSPSVAWAQVDLTVLDRDMAGRPAQVLVLGSVHLAQLPEKPVPGALDGVLDRLATFAPDIIVVEDVSGQECDLAARHPERYGSGYCHDNSAARAATGFDVPGALAAIDRTLETWPAQPTAAQRRRLAALFLAAHERASAYAQWLQLPEAERRPGDGLDQALVEMLGRIDAHGSESYSIGARLAARLGLQRVHGVDDNTGHTMDLPDPEAFGKAVSDVWSKAAPAWEASIARETELARAPDLLPLYRHINHPRYQQLAAEANVLTMMRADTPEDYPQMWVAAWETRNLRMVANIRESFRECPRARVLSIVGASHKPWFDSWLGQLQGVEIVDALEVLE